MRKSDARVRYTKMRIREAFLKRQISRTVEVLAETEEADGSSTGYTANYTPVRIESGAACGEFCQVRITEADKETCRGVIQPEKGSL